MIITYVTNSTTIYIYIYIYIYIQVIMFAADCSKTLYILETMSITLP
jgi:hypothetical protein